MAAAAVERRTSGRGAEEVQAGCGGGRSLPRLVPRSRLTDELPASRKSSWPSLSSAEHPQSSPPPHTGSGDVTPTSPANHVAPCSPQPLPMMRRLPSPPPPAPPLPSSHSLACQLFLPPPPFSSDAGAFVNRSSQGGGGGEGWGVKKERGFQCRCGITSPPCCCVWCFERQPNANSVSRLQPKMAVRTTPTGEDQRRSGHLRHGCLIYTISLN